MTYKWIFRLVVIVALAFTAVFTLQAFNANAGVAGSPRPSTGMGDLRRQEALQLRLEIGAPHSIQLQPSMGDLHRFEAVQVISGAPQAARFSPGLGDLRRFEDRHALNGMGGLHLFEAGK